MTGTSYNGTIPVAAASTGVEGLEAIIPIAPNNSYYRYYRANGLVRHPGGWLGEDIDFLYDFVNSGNPEFRGHCNATIRDGEMAAGMDRASGDYNDFWADRNLLRDVDNIRAATLMAHAFNDWNVKPEHSVLVYEALKRNGVPHQAYFHQGGHGGAPPLELMNRWFTRYLYGIENGVENDPKAWIVREGDERMSPTPYPEYPHPDAEPVVLYPTAGGLQQGGLGLAPVGGADHRNARRQLLVRCFGVGPGRMDQPPIAVRVARAHGRPPPFRVVTRTPASRVQQACGEPVGLRRFSALGRRRS